MNHVKVHLHHVLRCILNFKVPSLIDKMLNLQTSKVPGPHAEALNLLLKRPWDPVQSMITHHKPVSKIILHLKSNMILFVFKSVVFVYSVKLAVLSLRSLNY